MPLLIDSPSTVRHPPQPRRSARRLRLAAGCLAAAVATGCAQLPPPAPAAVALPPVEPPPAPVVAVPAPLPPPLPVAPPPTRSPTADADDATRQVLAFHERLRDMTPADLAREQARLGESPADPGSRLELALLWAYTRQNGDLARALALIEPLARPAAPAPWQPIARLLQTRLAEQRRLEEQGERQAASIREQQRRIDQLTGQIEALRAIERSLSTRPPAASPPASGPVRAP